MNDYVAPKYGLRAYNCPNCDAFAHQTWRNTIIAHGEESLKLNEFAVSTCAKCNKSSIWRLNELIYPIKSVAPLHSSDMPEEVAVDYDEARDIFEKSPKAATALLRLAIQKLCVILGESGENINNDIASLVEKGLPSKIQKALDIVRVVGNNAVHPGEINIDDNPAIALSLFKLLNLIVETMITQPKEVDDLFDLLPEGAKKAIEKRDSK